MPTYGFLTSGFSLRIVRSVVRESQTSPSLSKTKPYCCYLPFANGYQVQRIFWKLFLKLESFLRAFVHPWISGSLSYSRAKSLCPSQVSPSPAHPPGPARPHLEKEDHLHLEVMKNSNNLHMVIYIYIYLFIYLFIY